MIESQLGVPCTRQGLEHHLRKGTLTECVRKKSPWRLDPAVVVQEYQGKVTKKQRGRQLLPDGSIGHYQGGKPINGRQGSRVIPRDEEIDAVLSEIRGEGVPQLPKVVSPSPSSGVKPNLLLATNAAKAWAELEKARKLQVERLAAEGQYVRISTIQPVWEKAFLSVSRSLMGVPSKIKSDFPDMSFEMVDAIRRECRSCLEKAFHEIMKIEEPEAALTDEELQFPLPDEGDMEFEV